MKNNIRTLSSGKFIVLGVLFSIAFWFVDGLIDTLFFSHAGYWESLHPNGMELYMRLLLCLAIIGFGILASRYVEANNQLNRYIALSLQEDSNRYKAIYESMPFSIVVVNQDLLIIDWNLEAEKCFGWKAHEALGKDFYKLLFPDDTQPKSPSIAQLIPAGYLVAPNMTKSGQFVNYSWTHIGVRDWEGQTNSVLLIGQKYLNINGH